MATVNNPIIAAYTPTVILQWFVLGQTMKYFQDITFWNKRTLQVVVLYWIQMNPGHQHTNYHGSGKLGIGQIIVAHRDYMNVGLQYITRSIKIDIHLLYSQLGSLAPCAGSKTTVERRIYFSWSRNGIDCEILYSSIQDLDNSQVGC
jgi:hypothetical protein